MILPLSTTMMRSALASRCFCPPDSLPPRSPIIVSTPSSSPVIKLPSWARRAHRISAGLDWDTPWVNGLSVNGRVIYTSEAYLTTANTVTFPSWTRVDAGLRYATNLNGRPVTYRANIENLFDETYWITTGTFATVGSPRTFILSAAFDF